MKKKIVIGSILSVIVLIILPSVSAVEFNTAVELNKTQILQQIQIMNIGELRGEIKNLDFQELKENLKNIGSNERMQLLQIFVKSSHNKSFTIGIFLLFILMLFSLIKSGNFAKNFNPSYHPNIIDKIGTFFLFIFSWAFGIISGRIPFMPFWLFIFISWLVLLAG